MAYNYGAVGYTTISSAGAVDSSNSVRVFDLAFCGTSNIVAAIQVYNGENANSGSRIIQLPVANWYLHSDGGYKFPNGCYVVASNCTATINYIREF